jgi:hypothetical protein
MPQHAHLAAILSSLGPGELPLLEEAKAVILSPFHPVWQMGKRGGLMSKRSAHLGWSCCLAALALQASGCGQDADRLARIGRQTTVKLDNLAGGAHGKVAHGWEAIRGSWSEATLDSRVATRLHWDKHLAEVEIQVDSPSPGVVRLQGALPDVSQRTRAMEIARSTLGVEKVVDNLTTTSSE